MKTIRSEKIVMNLNNFVGEIEDGYFEIRRQVPNIRHLDIMSRLSLVELQDLQVIVKGLLIEAERIINDVDDNTNPRSNEAKSGIV